MMRLKSLFLFTLFLTFSLALTVQAQTIQPTPGPVNTDANISWPPPVYVLRGQFTVRGSANLPNMVSYYLEFRPLADDLSAPNPAAPWFPVTVPNPAAVKDDVLGIWDTTPWPDGVYELRLTLNLRGADPVYFRVAPLRLENNPPPFAITPTPAIGLIEPAAATATALAQTIRPTVIAPPLAATPTAFDATPRVVSRTNANVRRGDSTLYEAFAALRPGQEVPVIGISSFGTGWYLVRLPDGRQGWVAPSVVEFFGDVARLPRVDPPPPPTPTPIPFTPTPALAPNLVAGNFRFDPPSPQCGQTFNIYLDVANFGNAPSPSTIVLVQDFRNADGSFQTSTIGGIPPIQPGQTINVGPIPLTVATWYNEDHRLVMTIDPDNAVFETTKADNVKVAIYNLPKAGCP